MARLTSGRVKKTPQSGITSDRYQFLGLDQAEPDLGDPLVGPSSIAAKPAPPGTRYVPVTIGGETGERYWLDAQQFFGASTPGAITVYDEATQVGAANSTYIIQFIGDGVSVDAVGTAISEQTGVATVRISTPNVYWTQTSSGIHTLSNVGVGTTNPTSILTVKGNTSLETLNVSGVSTFRNNVNFGTQCSISTSGNSLSINANTDVIISGYYGGTKITSQPGANLVFVDAVAGDVSLYYQVSAGPSGSEKRLQTLGTGVTITGTTFTNQLSVSGFTTFTGPVRFFASGASDFIQYQADSFIFRDNQSITMGNGTDLTLVHDGETTRMTNSGPLVIRNNSVSGITSIAGNTVGTIADFTQDGEVRIPGKLQIGVGATVITTTSNGSIGIGTTNPQAKVHIVGSGSTALLVNGDVRVVGVLTVGSSSITFDGINNTVSIGTVRLADQSGNANYSGIVTATSFVGDLTGNASTAGIATYSSNAGVATYSSNAGVATYSSNAGVATYSSNAGIATYAPNAGIATGLISTANINTSGIITAASFVGDGSQLTGITDNIGPWTTTDVGIHTLSYVGIGTTNPTRQLEVNGTIKVTNGDVEIPNGYALVINGQNAVTVTGLGDQITSSSLTSVGTLQRLNVGGNLNVTGISTFTSIDISNSTTNSISTSFSSISTEVLHAGISTSSYRSVEYMVQATEGSRFQAIKVLAIHDGTTAYKTEYGNIYNSGTIASFDVDVSGGNLRLVATASTSSSVTYKVHYTTIKS